MWGSNLDERKLQPNSDAANQHIHNPTEEVEAPGDEYRGKDGTWGEIDVGGFNREDAYKDFLNLRRDLTQLERSRSKETQHSLRKTATGGSTRSRNHMSKLKPQRSRLADSTHTASTQPGQPSQPPIDATEKADLDPAPADDGDDDEGEFELEQFMREGHFEKRTEGKPHKKVGVVYKNLVVKGNGSTANFVRTLPQAILGTFGPDLWSLICRFIPTLARKTGETRTLLHGFSGVVRDGEMLLVLGKPGAGCSTFLKAISNNRESYAEVTGDVSYGGIPADKQKKMYRGEVNYNPEDDVHFPSLTVWQTLTFALSNKTPKRARKDIPIIANALIRMFGIGKTKNTLVGDEYTRGVSGGERKRVSIAETLASKSSVVAWDNSTRGLDASTALDYARSLRIMTDVSNRTTITTLYQAGEGIYEQMDKVLVIDQGREIYNGPCKDAKRYFTDLGFQCPERQTTADFLTALTDPVERRFRPGYEDRAPKTAVELEKAFRDSSAYQRVREDIAEYERYLEETNYQDADRFETAVQEGKSKHVSKKSPYTVSFIRQVSACTKREFLLMIGDTTALWTKVFIIISNGLIVGSLFYGESFDTSGAFSRGGALFFSILFLGWLQLTELMKAVSGRVVVARHTAYAFYRPSAVCLARVVLDFPVIAVQVILFGIIMYFLTNLTLTASQFFIYMLFVYVNTIMLTALYRMFAALSPEIDTAVRFASIALNLLVLYTGYVIPKPQLLTKYIWFGWLYNLNPVAYVFEGVLTNEFSHRTMNCSPSQLVPPDLDPDFQGCSIPGAAVNGKTVTGASYLETQYNYSRSNLWRNFGVVIAFTVLYILITVLATELLDFSAGGGALLFKKSKRAIKQLSQENSNPADEEKAPVSDDNGSASSTNKETGIGEGTGNEQKEQDALEQITKSGSVFAWRGVNYKVPYLGGERTLLNDVSGYVRPGLLIALMGASGAGKTTLLNTLSQRNHTGVVGGDMLVDGRPLPLDFQRNTGFCLQGDLHDGTATIREALEFSAILRQDATIPRTDKIAYVDKIIDLLELNDLQDAIIMSLGVEQRKRVTIGVELAAKPSLLLFLDEPTSGLDSQSAYSIVRFLKKLCRAGQAIVCTIHQPSSILIQQFDMICALKQGETFYFGSVGEDGRDVIKYFGDRGEHCPPQKNVAEFILETAARPKRLENGNKVDWCVEWRRSDNAQEVTNVIEGLKRTRSKSQPDEKRKENEREFAAPVSVQCSELLKRTFKQYWRDPSYLYGKLFVSVIMGIFNGFTFWQLGNSILDMQNRMFTVFLALILPPSIVNAVVPKFFAGMTLWEAREGPSKTYGWFAFCTAQTVAEVPPAIVSAIVYWALWYWPTGLPAEASVSGYVFLMVLLFFLFQASWGQWICAFAPSYVVISNVLPFFFVIFTLFTGVVTPYTAIPVGWHWLYHLNPATWYLNGVLAATLDGIPIECQETETARFDTPGGLTCAQYVGDQSNGGYLLNPDATSNCMMCPYSVGNQYLSTLNISPHDKWRGFGVFLVFVFTNWFLVYFFIWSVRVKKWTFGFGALFGALGKLVDVLKKIASSGR